MGLQSNSLAAAVGASVKNVTFKPEALNVPRKILGIGVYDPLKTLIVDEVPIQVLSPEDAGDKLGFGFMLHRLVTQIFAGSNGVECWVIPQAETGIQAVGSHTFAASGLLAGTVYMYIAGILVGSFTVAAGDTSDSVAAKANTALNAIKELPVTSSVATNVLTATAKSKGTWGNDISLKFNIKPGEEFPTGLTVVTVDMAGGAGTPAIADALDALGTGDDANEAFFTDVVHGYGQDSTTLDAISAYVGAGNDFLGLYSKTVARPFRVLTGDVVAGSSGLTALTALGNGRKLDRANGVVAVPGSANHPSEIAALAIGIMARINNDRVAQSYIGRLLNGIDPGEKADRWTSEYDNRDTAVKAGISPTKIASGVVTLQNVVTFYHPDSVPISSNAYRSMRNICIMQNILDNIRVNFEREKWQGISIVEDVTKVSNPTDRVKARDISAVIDDLVALAKSFESKAWIFEAAFTINKLKAAGAVTIRPGAIGFDNVLKVILSGEGGILDTVAEIDTSIAVLL